MGPVTSKELLNKSSALSQWRPLPNARSYPADCLGPKDSLVNLSCSHFPTVFTELGFLSVNKTVQIWVGCHGNCIRSPWALYLPLLTAPEQWTPCGAWVPSVHNLMESPSWEGTVHYEKVSLCGEGVLGYPFWYTALWSHVVCQDNDFRNFH